MASLVMDQLLIIHESYNIDDDTLLPPTPTPVDERSIVCLSVRGSVCPLVYFKNCMSEFPNIFRTRGRWWPWLGPSLTTV